MKTFSPTGRVTCHTVVTVDGSPLVLTAAEFAEYRRLVTWQAAFKK